MKRIFKILLIYSFCISLYSCVQQEKTKQILRELQSHYKNEEDKLAAARFLLENLAYKHTYVGWQIDSLKELKKKSIQKGRISEEIVDYWQNFDYKKLKKIRDVDILTSDYIIENIDLAYSVWKERPWSKYYSFNDFCEYILPYRIEDEPLENWRKVYYERYAPVLDSLYQGDDVVDAARAIAGYLQQEGFTNHTDFVLPHLGALYLLENRVSFCRETCDITIYVMRALGIPVAIDFYPMSPSYNSQHFWNALIDTNHLAVPFNYMEGPISRKRLKSERKKGKVYRSFYAKQKAPVSEIKLTDDVPTLFKDSFIRDVSEEYFPNKKVRIKMKTTFGNDIGYLSFFTGQALFPVDISEIINDSATFSALETNVIYFPSVMQNGEIVSSNYPFIYKDGNVSSFIPDHKRLTTVTVERKYPIRNNLTFLASACGVRIEGANQFDFSDSVLLYEVIDTLPTNYNIICPTIKKNSDMFAIRLLKISKYNWRNGICIHRSIYIRLFL